MADRTSSSARRSAKMTGESRIRVSLGAGEVEVEGTEKFVAQYDEPIRAVLARLITQPTPARSATGSVPSAVPTSPTTGRLEFGELLHSLPKSVTATDQILVAGLHASQMTADGTFSTGDANRLLIEQGVKIANASQSLRNALTAKRVFKVGKGFKISKLGEEYIQTLTSH
jgi:hypothetical protein